ncbi:MAG: hypothetical protein LBK82_02540 [Planctomycetaceae bacterium]|nr:hypothetical protein [Planctomycetaceae bacterium]
MSRQFIKSSAEGSCRLTRHCCRCSSDSLSVKMSGRPFAERSRRIDDSRLVPCFRLAIRFPNGRQHKIAVVNLVHCRLTPTQPFSERLPTS